MLDVMSIIMANKNIGTAGTSKMVTVTQEAKELGLDAKDTITVAFAKPNSPEDYALRLSSTFCNPHAMYINDKILCSKDRDQIGQQIENLLTDSNREELQIINNRFNAMQQLIGKIREFTKSEVAGQYAYYSEELRTFIMKFYPEQVVEEDPFQKKITELLANLDAVEACLKLPVFAHSEIDSVRKMPEYIHRAFFDTVRLLHCEPDKRKEYLRELNRAWQEEINNVVYKDLYYIGLVIPCHVKGDDRIFDCDPIIETIPAPTQRIANKSIRDSYPEDDGLRNSYYILGPYDEERECRDLVAYLNLKWKMEIKEPADDSTVVWVKNTVNEYNIMMG